MRHLHRLELKPLVISLGFVVRLAVNMNAWIVNVQHVYVNKFMVHEEGSLRD